MVIKRKVSLFIQLSLTTGQFRFAADALSNVTLCFNELFAILSSLDRYEDTLQFKRRE